MTREEETSLRQWAERHACCGVVQAAQVLDLLKEKEAMVEQIAALCQLIVAQSELLSKRAEHVVPG